MGQTWYVVFVLLSGTCLAEYEEAPGCDCALSQCCAEMLLPIQEDYLSWLVQDVSQVGATQQKLSTTKALLPPSCELLALSENASATCNNGSTICSALEPDIMKRFPNQGIKEQVVMGRFIGQGTCAEVRAQTCAVTSPEMLRIDRWRRSQLHWEDTTETINFTNGSVTIAPLSYPQMQFDETCDHDHLVLKINAKWIPEDPSLEEKPAANVQIAEGNWQRDGDDAFVKWMCVDLKTPLGAAGYHALYLTVGDYPCKSVPGFPSSVMIRGLIILGLIVVACLLCWCIALLVTCSRNKDEEDSDEDSDWDGES